MDHVPRQETVRLLATAAYLPVVPIVLLASRRYRDIRLIRFHAYQAIGLFIWLVLMLLLGSMASTLFGGLPGVGDLINLAVGLLFVIALLGGTGVAFYGAAMGYQGNYTSIPILTDWVWTQVNGSGRAQPAGEARPRRKKVKKRAPPPEASWEERVVASEEEPF